MYNVDLPFTLFGTQLSVNTESIKPWNCEKSDHLISTTVHYSKMLSLVSGSLS